MRTARSFDGSAPPRPTGDPTSSSWARSHRTRHRTIWSRCWPSTGACTIPRRGCTWWGHRSAGATDRRSTVSWPISGLSDAVTVVGSIPPEELEAYYRTADVFVCASEHEGFCVPIVEAMAHDLPVVAYAAAAVPETVQDAGLLLESKEPLRFAAAVHRVMEDKLLRRQFSAGGRPPGGGVLPLTVEGSLRRPGAGRRRVLIVGRAGRHRAPAAPVPTCRWRRHRRRRSVSGGRCRPVGCPRSRRRPPTGPRPRGVRPPSDDSSASVDATAHGSFSTMARRTPRPGPSRIRRQTKPRATSAGALRTRHSRALRWARKRTKADAAPPLVAERRCRTVAPGS